MQAVGKPQYSWVDYSDGTISTAPGNPNDGGFPGMAALNPQPGRDWGLEFQYRF